MLRYIYFFFILLTSCKKEVVLKFSDRTLFSEKNAIISIIIPEVQGNSLAAKNINKILERFACNALNIDASKTPQFLIEKSAKQFDASYIGFKKQISNELSQELPVWEANIDGELTYKNETIISVAMNSSINTGSAKNNLKIKFFNFNASTGEIIDVKNIVNDLNAFKQLVKKYYDKELLTKYTNGQSLIESTNFKLPESIGFSNDGVIIFYNSYELLMPSTETLEFMIPYEIANNYLTF